MALVKSALETQLFAAFKRAQSDTSEDQDAALRTLCSDIATAFDMYVRSATVVSNGIGYAGTPVISTSTSIT